MQNTTNFTRSFDRKVMNGTSRQGTLRASYSDIVAAFGVPDMYGKDDGDGKVLTRWVFRTEHGPVSIYDYKPEKAPEAQTIWSVGGKFPEVVAVLKDEFSERTDLCGGCGYHVTRCKMDEECMTPGRPF